MTLEYQGGFEAGEDGDYVLKVRYEDADTGERMELTFEENELLLKDAQPSLLKELNITRSTLMQGRDAFPLEYLRDHPPAADEERDVVQIAQLDM